MSNFINTSTSALCWIFILLQLIIVGIQADSQTQESTSFDAEPNEILSMPIEHMSNQDCGPEQCLVVGMQTYSEPRCVNLGQQGDFCRPTCWARNATLHYPNKILKADNIYTLFCPCSKGLECVKATCSPK